MTDSEPEAITALVWPLLPDADEVALRLRDLSDDIDGLVASQLWTEASAAFRLTTSNIAGAIIGQTQREVLANLGVGHLALRRDPAMAQAVGDPDLLDDLASIEPDDDPGPLLAEILTSATRRPRLTASTTGCCGRWPRKRTGRTCPRTATGWA